MRKALALASDEIESLVIQSGYLESAPFSWVTVQFSFGLKYSKRPTYGRISKKYSDLPLTVEVGTNKIVDADVGTIKEIFTTALLRALIFAGERSGRPTQLLTNPEQRLM